MIVLSLQIQSKFRVGYYGQAKKKQIYLGKQVVNRHFSPQNRLITLEFGGTLYYTRLPDSFFTKCPELRTAYDTPSCEGVNRLHQWLAGSGAAHVQLQVVVPYRQYRIF